MDWKVIAVTLVLSLSCRAESPGPRLSPFFFLCNYHGSTQNYGLDNGEVVVSVEIEGDPAYYLPGEFYHVTISTSQHFDNFLMTGLYTTPTVKDENTMILDRHPTPRFATGQNLMCSIVHSRVSRSPLRKINFVWMAPPSGTGCVSFLATATYNKQVLFKDTTVLQLCEFGAISLTPEQPILAEIHSDTVLLRDDFEGENGDFSPDIWQNADGGYVGDSCGSVVHGYSAIFCDSDGDRRLVTLPLNLTSARVLQFTLGAGGCRDRILPDPDIVISYGINSCTFWIDIKKIKAPMLNTPEVHILSLPEPAKRENTCLMFSQPLAFPTTQAPYGTQKTTEASKPTVGGVISMKPVPVPTNFQQMTTDDMESFTSKPSISDVTITKSIPNSTDFQQTTPENSVEVTSITTKKSKDTSPSVPIETTPVITKNNENTSPSEPAKTTPIITKNNENTSPSEPAKTTPIITKQSDNTSPSEPAKTTPIITKNNENTSPSEPAKTTPIITKQSENTSPSEPVEPTTVDPFDYDLNPNKISFNAIPNDQPWADDPLSFVAFYHGCWAVDNIVVVNTASPPTSLSDDLDPIDPGNWIFFPGAHIKSQCHSDGNAFVFDERNQSMTFAVTRDLDLSISEIKQDALFFEDFDSTNLRVDQTGGRKSGDCGDVHAGQPLVLDGGKRRQICTQSLRLEQTSAVHFYFQFGQGKCHSSSSSSPVLVYLEDVHEQTFVLRTLHPQDFKMPQLVSFSLADTVQDIPYDNSLRLCLLQKSHGGIGKDIWVVDTLSLLPLLPSKSKEDKSKVFQASLNMQCEQEFGEAKTADDSVLSFEFSTDHGENWNLFYPKGNDHNSLQAQYSRKELEGWKRLTLPLPIVAQSPLVRFRVFQYGNSSDAWALDDVFVGKCKDWCNGHGMCSNSGCKCDFGYDGETCDSPTVPAPSNFHETFEDPNVVGSSPMLDTVGAVIGYQCSVLASGKALVFNQAGTRSITTAEIDTTNIKAIKFTLRIGSQSVTSSCPPPSDSMSGIILDSSCNGGITWSEIKTFSSSSYRRPVSFSVPLEETSKGKLCQFRWRQPTKGEKDKNVWAIDDIMLAERDLNSLAVEMMDMPDFGERLTSNHGKLTDSFCERMRSAVFSSPEKNGEYRSLMTSAMKVGPGYVAQFDLVMGCGLPYADGVDNQIYFLYSSDHGINWQLVQPACLLPHICKEYMTGSVYHHTGYRQWKTVTIVLSEDTWGQETRFRWTQPIWGDSDVWAINRINIGPACPHLCHGQGTCHAGLCRCFKGFTGESCSDSRQMDSSIHAPFGPRYDPTRDFTITGGNVLRAGEGCGTLLAGRSLHFSEAGDRELVTKTMNAMNADFIQFYIRIGGEGKGSNCHGAETRKESVLLQYSNNSGIQWHLIQELHHLEHQKPQFIHSKIPDAAKSAHTRFRWWQPTNSGQNHDQWAIDEILIGSYRNYRTIGDDFDDDLDIMASDQWRLVTDGIAGKYCGSLDPSLVLSNQINDKLVITQDLNLNAGDVIQFEINVDCGKVFRWDHPVIFQYSHDHGKTWKLVVEPCYLDQDCEGRLTEGSIYYTGTHGKWTLVAIPVTDKIAMHPVIFKWWQQGGVDHSFSLDNVYIGPPCRDNCHRRGLCIKGKCNCLDNEQKLKDEDCTLLENPPSFLLDRFDNSNMPSMLWSRILSGHLGRGCGMVKTGNSLYFGGEGTREALTHPLDTRDKRILEFTYKLGDEGNAFSCRRPRHRNEGIIADFSTDNEITWQTLRVLEPNFENSTAQTVVIELPPEAKDKETVFRFWQPLGLGGMPRAQWAIDNVLIGINESSNYGFTDKFTGMMPNPDNWFLADAAVQRPTCDSKGNALEFSGKKGQRVAETWDYNVNPSTFLQFELAMGCGSLASSLYDIQLEYSTDLGRSWNPVIDECIPPNFECSGYHVSSNYVSDQYANWTRITVALPEGAVSPATRFRWIQPKRNSKGTIWSIDNVFVGDDCPWLCSGHGVCHAGKCVCDLGFTGEYCVPDKPLAMQLRDNFNKPKMDPRIWREVVGGDNSLMCGSAVSGRSMTFYKVGPRMAVTQDMDSSMLIGMEFYFAYGCGDHIVRWPREHSVLLQYSTSGGIHWKLIKEIHFSNSEIKFYSIPLPMGARHNATRFRFWQPRHGGEKHSVWAVDNLFIGTMAMRPGNLYDDFDLGEPDSMAWLFINNGEVDEYCSKQTRQDSRKSGVNSLVFRRKGGGEVSVETTDLELGPMAVLQFDINVGCGAEPSSKYPVRLEYSTDGGLSWSLVGPNCGQLFGGRCFESGVPLTIYYAGESIYWRRIAMPLDHIQVCGAVRFRWFQGKIPDSDFAPEWAIDNVYIGMACLEHCNGHGSCFGGLSCDCDEGYKGESCVSSKHNPTYLKEDFDNGDKTDDNGEDNQKGLLQPSLSDKRKGIDETKWEYWTGGRIVGNHPCGPVFEKDFFLHDKEGQRTLTTVPLDLSNAHSVQFHLKRGCGTSVPVSPPLYLQYSVNGGMLWTTMEQFHFNNNTNKDAYLSIHLPSAARTNSTQIRWWLPSADGRYSVEWAIDQVFIGGDVNGQVMLQDDPGVPSEKSWLESLGAKKGKECGSEDTVLHFKNTLKERYAVSGDVVARKDGIVQFTVSMRCSKTDGKQLSCFSLEIQYSIDMGQSWHLLIASCPQSKVSCANPYSSSVLYSDEFSRWKRVTIKIPKEAWSSQTRFRVYQSSGGNSKETWAIGNLYIGSTCPNDCSNHGQCRHYDCFCDDGWNGTDCSISLQPLPKLLVQDFNSGIHFPNWVSMVGGQVVSPCRPLSGEKVLHMRQKCSRLIETIDLDLRSGGYIQFYFMYGCLTLPATRDEGVLLHYSVDAGITWQIFTEMNYNMYRTPVLINLKIPDAAKQNGVRFRLQQMQHGGEDKSDWLIDGFRIQGDDVNPQVLVPDWSKPFDYNDVSVIDNMKVGNYCGKVNTAAAKTPLNESSTLATREVHIEEGSVLQFSINVGCGQPWNSSIMPVKLQFSTDNGVTWSDQPVTCLNGASCSTQDSKISFHYHGVHGNWRRFIVPLDGLTKSNGTRFRWQQLPSGGATPHTWALTNVYVGPECVDSCHGNGFCVNQTCVCDEGYGGVNCVLEEGEHIQTQLKDSFDQLYGASRTKLPWLQGGNVEHPCHTLSQGPALVMAGPGAREVVTRRLDLRDAKFVQYIVSMWSKPKHGDRCSPPPSHKTQSVALQYSTNNGIHWNTLHILSPDQYWPKRRDYIVLPPEARTNNTVIRWFQNAKPILTSPRVHWALEDVYIGGKEISPSQYVQSFNDNKVKDDPDAWEFSPYGALHSKEDSACLSKSVRGGAMVWEPKDDDTDKDDAKFVTNQMIVQPGYLMQFKLIIGCGHYLDVCQAPDTKVRLEFRRNPSSETWLPVKPICLPGNQNSGLCNPHQHHLASFYSLSQFPDWSRVTILLSEATFSSSTQFRWVVEKDNTSLSWALDDILIGEQCEAMCHGRGDCVRGQCICDDGYFGSSCLPNAAKLRKRLFESFEGGIFTSNWQLVTGGAIGFGCGALLPFAYGKSLYFNGCGERQAVTTEMDTSYAIKIFFVIQIGCHAQTDECNVQLGDEKKYRGVLLQYSKTKGADWFLIAQHDPEDFLQPKKVAYDIPRTAKGVGTQFRWWQPQHDGKGFDQWAIDHVEIISGRRHFRRGRRRWRRT